MTKGIAKRLGVTGIVMAASLLNPATAQACCTGGPQPPTPAELEFIAQVHDAGLPGSPATREISPYGYEVEIGNWPGLSVRDSNILYAGYAICTGLQGPSSTKTFEYWKSIYSKLGEPIDPVDGYHPKISQATNSARNNLCPGAPE